jgi:hypothetical protein
MILSLLYHASLIISVLTVIASAWWLVRMNERARRDVIEAIKSRGHMTIELPSGRIVENTIDLNKIGSDLTDP